MSVDAEVTSITISAAAAASSSPIRLRTPTSTTLVPGDVEGCSVLSFASNAATAGGGGSGTAVESRLCGMTGESPINSICSSTTGISMLSAGGPSSSGTSFNKWSQILTVVLAVLCFFGLVVVFGVLNVYGALTPHVAAYVFSGYCAMLAVVLSLSEVWLHITCYTNPPVQNRFIRILLMVPIYSLQSWIALRFRHLALYMNLIRDSYESYVIYTFFSLLLVYMDGEERCVDLLTQREPLKILPPCCCLGPIKLGYKFLLVVKICLLQYVISKPFCALLAMILYPLGLYTEGDILSLKDGYMWITMGLNLSVTCAFSALVYFYLATRLFIRQYHPTWKFICVKAVVFMSFWQGVIVALLIKVHIIKATVAWNVHEVGMGLQDFLICIEMLVIAILHKTVFSHRPFKPAHGRLRPTKTQIGQALNPRYMVQDVVNEFTGLLRRDGAFSPLQTGSI